MVWLVTGGAGYIGSHVVQALLDAGFETAVLDDFSTGYKDFLPKDVPVFEGSIIDKDFLQNVFLNDFDGVIHLAGYKYAGESVNYPLRTYEQNIVGTVNLLQEIKKKSINNFVFSSSASVYGTPDVEIVTEETTLKPESPYGESKLVGEWLVSDLVRSGLLKATSLRYFNVVGSQFPYNIVDLSPYNLFPRVFRAIDSGQSPKIFGNDFPTPDGTCVRDYVHVHDVALAHVEAAKNLLSGKHMKPAYNLGAGEGTSVLEIMLAAREVTKSNFDYQITSKRPGDPAQIVASGKLAEEDLNWKNRHSINEMLFSAWIAWNQRVSIEQNS